VDTQELTIKNTDLWTKYYQDQWSRMLNPFGLPVPELAEGTAARVAGFLTIVAAGPIAWLYNTKEPQTAAIEPADDVAAALPLRMPAELESIEDHAAA
jgi:hypothetical protein